jgi:predicted lipid-binding transport protein (Tim44 family)
VPADLIVYGLVAAGLVFWLRSILGTRHGEERPRSEAYMALDKVLQDAEASLDDAAQPTSVADDIRELRKTARVNYGIDNDASVDGLLAIAAADRDFDIHFFMQGAQDAFVMIVESFAEGDREALGDLLGDDVYKAFEGAIVEREEAKHTQVTDIHAIRNAEVIEAGLDGRTASVTLRFTAEESSVTRDEEGNVIAGDADAVSEMKDIWVLSRDVKSKDPSWLLVETRGGFEDDNDLIPDTV